MNLYKRNFYCHIKGMSLIEVMIAMTIGLLLLSGAVSLFINNKRIYRDNDQSARLQESARLSMELLRKDIRRAGFMGCHHDINNLTNGITIGTPSGSLYEMFIISGGDRISLAIEGLDSTDNRWVPSSNSALVASGTALGERVSGNIGRDAITVRYLDGEFWPVLADNDAAIPARGFATSNNVPVVISTMDNHPQDGRNDDRANNVIKGELLGISDCSSAFLFQTGSSCTSVQSQSNPLNVCSGGVDGEILPVISSASVIVPGNTSSRFDRVYAQGASIRRYRAVRYYIGNGDYGGPSLFQQTLVNVTINDSGVAQIPQIQVVNQELVQGVEAMRILYGLDRNNDGAIDLFYKADGVGDPGNNARPIRRWHNVMSVKIALLIRTVSQDPIDDPDTATYRLLDQTFNPPDLRVRRRVFEAVVQIRNRIVDEIN